MLRGVKHRTQPGLPEQVDGARHHTIAFIRKTTHLAGHCSAPGLLPEATQCLSGTLDVQLTSSMAEERASRTVQGGVRQRWTMLRVPNITSTKLFCKSLERILKEIA